MVSEPPPTEYPSEHISEQLEIMPSKKPASESLFNTSPIFVQYISQPEESITNIVEILQGVYQKPALRQRTISSRRSDTSSETAWTRLDLTGATPKELKHSHQTTYHLERARRINRSSPQPFKYCFRCGSWDHQNSICLQYDYYFDPSKIAIT